MAVTIDGTDGISPLKASGQTQTTTGTAAAPAISSSSDTDSGFSSARMKSIFRQAAAPEQRLIAQGGCLLGRHLSLYQVVKKLQMTHSNAGAEIVLGRDDSSVTSGNSLGAIKFVGNDGGTYQQCSKIEAIADGTHANNDKPTRLVFSVTGDNESSPTERLRLGNSAELTLRPATYGMGVRSVAGSSSVNTAYFGAHSSTSMTAGTITLKFIQTETSKTQTIHTVSYQMNG